MEFSRVGQHTIRCIISEEEIFDLGYTIDEIMSNGERTQEFMNYIFDKAEQKFQTKFDLGVKTVRADFLPDHTISITFSEHPSSGNMMEHLKDIVSGLLNSIPAEKWEEIKTEASGKAEPGRGDSGKSTEPVKVIVLIRFDSLDIVTRFSKQVALSEIPNNVLYKHNNYYFLVMDLSEASEQEVLRLSMLTDEYATDILVGADKKAFMEEHGEVILKSEAIQNLRQL